MPVIKTDLVDGNNGSFTEAGWEINRVVVVSELIGFGYEMLIEAVVFTAANIGVIGTRHPLIETAFIEEYNPESVGPAEVQVTVVYRQFTEDIEYNIQSTGEIIQRSDYLVDPTQRGAFTFAPMEIEYTYPSDYLFNPELAGETGVLGTTANILVPGAVLLITRNERVSIKGDNRSGWAVGIPTTGNILLDRNLYYSGSTNKSGWRLRPKDPKNTWRCDGIDSILRPDGFTWRVTYRFTYNKFTWDHIGTFKDPATGFPPPDVENTGNLPTGGNGRGTFKQYLQRDFNPLKLF